jgi:hypothetical protein
MISFVAVMGMTGACRRGPGSQRPAHAQASDIDATYVEPSKCLPLHA